MSSTDDFKQVSQAFLEVVERIQPEQWSAPGLGSWDVRSLVGHTARAILTVENYLSLDEPGHVSIETAESYFSSFYAQYTDPASIAERGVEAGVWLGDDPASMVREARERAVALIEAQHPNRVVSIGGMGVPLDEYLRTRVFELVVHTLDVERATGVAHAIPSGPLSRTVLLATSTALDAGRGEEVLLALTGRQPLPEGFSVV